MSAEPDAQSAAESDIKDIYRLRNEKAFDRYFLKQVRREIARLEGELTSEPQVVPFSNPAYAEALRNVKLGEIKVWRAVLNKLDADEAGNRAILGLPADIKLTDGPPLP